MNSTLFTYVVGLGAGAFQLVPSCRNSLTRVREVAIGLVTLAQIVEALTHTDGNFPKRYRLSSVQRTFLKRHPERNC